MQVGQRNLLRVVAATLHLSNVEMGEEVDWDGNSVATVGYYPTVQYAELGNSDGLTILLRKVAPTRSVSVSDADLSGCLVSGWEIRA